MERIAKIIESRPGLTHDEALKSLQSHPEFKLGTIIESVKPRGNVWVAKLLEPKVAAEFPFGDDSDDDSEDKVEEVDAPSEDDSEDKPEPPKDEKKDDSKSEKSEISELVDLVHAIADKLGIAPELPDLEDDAPIGEPPPGPPAGPPPSPKGGPEGHPAGPRPQKDIPPTAAPLTGFAAQAKAGQIPSFEVATQADISIKEAVADLKEEFPKHTVKQLKHDKASNRYLAKLSLY